MSQKRNIYVTYVGDDPDSLPKDIRPDVPHLLRTDGAGRGYIKGVTGATHLLLSKHFYSGDWRVEPQTNDIHRRMKLGIDPFRQSRPMGEDLSRGCYAGEVREKERLRQEAPGPIMEYKTGLTTEDVNKLIANKLNAVWEALLEHSKHIEALEGKVREIGESIKEEDPSVTDDPSIGDVLTGSQKARWDEAQEQGQAERKPAVEWPRKGETYWFISNDGIIHSNPWYDTMPDKQRQSFLGIFSTKEAALQRSNNLRIICRALDAGKNVEIRWSTDTSVEVRNIYE